MAVVDNWQITLAVSVYSTVSFGYHTHYHNGFLHTALHCCGIPSHLFIATYRKFIPCFFPPVYPVPRDTETRYTVEAGESVTMECVIRPGALYQQYSVFWRRGLQTLVSSHSPNANGYRVNLADFSLIIDNVEVNDEDSDYNCEVIVDNPQSENNIRRTGPDITLIVYGKEIMTLSPLGCVMFSAM